MNIIYYLVILGLLFLIIEVISIIFKITGLDLNKARFQVISIITHTGFTTRESELIAQHPLRRRIASYLMILSYLGQATLISIFFNILKQQQSMRNILIIILVLSTVILILARNKVLLFKFESFLEKYILRQMKINKKYRTIDEVLKLNDDFGVTEIVLEEDSPLVGISLSESGLKERYIQVLTVDRGSHLIHFPKANLVFEPADRVVVYGKIDSIKELILEQK